MIKYAEEQFFLVIKFLNHVCVCILFEQRCEQITQVNFKYAPENIISNRFQSNEKACNVLLKKDHLLLVKEDCIRKRS